MECAGRAKRRRRFSLAQVFTPGSKVGHPVFDSPIYGARIVLKPNSKPPEGGELILWFVLFLGPRREESVSKLVSEHGAVAMGS